MLLLKVLHSSLVVSFLIMQRFNDSIEHIKDVSEFLNDYLQKMTEESSKLGGHASQIEEIQIQSISAFQKAFEVCCFSFCACVGGSLMLRIILMIFVGDV